jgi:hypothetical protein
MDPYIEACGLWEDFHNHLIEKIGEELADAAPDRYLVRTGEMSFVMLVESDDERRHPILPDVSVTSAGRKRKRVAKESATALADPDGDGEPIEMRAFIPEEHRETFVEIIEADERQRLVTTVEVLSPTNKRHATEGWELYQRKRQCVLLGNVSLVEIDLLRGGRRMPMLDPWPDSPYTLLVARAGNSVCRVWRAQFRRPLPSIPVPLAKPDPDIRIELQPMIDEIYRRFRYARSIDYKKPLAPPLDAADSAWLKRQLRARAERC